MEETKEKKNILFIIIFVLLILETGYIIYSNFIKTDNKPTNNNQSQVENDKTNEDNNIKDEQNNTSENINNYKEVKINSLTSKLSKLDFTNKTTAIAGVDDELPFSISIISNKEVKVTHNYANLSYTLPMENAISVGAGFSVEGPGFAVFYILTSNGSIYRVEDNMENVRTNSSYKGTALDMGVKEATQICVTDNISLNDESLTASPNVYIKTSDNKVLTDERLLDSEKIVSVIEK